MFGHAQYIQFTEIQGSQRPQEWKGHGVYHLRIMKFYYNYFITNISDIVCRSEFHFMPQIFSFSRMLKHFSYSKNLSCSEKINKYSLAFSFLGFPFSRLFSFFNFISSTLFILPVLFSLQFYFFFKGMQSHTYTHTHTHMTRMSFSSSKYKGKVFFSLYLNINTHTA